MENTNPTIVSPTFLKIVFLSVKLFDIFYINDTYRKVPPATPLKIPAIVSLLLLIAQPIRTAEAFNNACNNEYFIAYF